MKNFWDEIGDQFPDSSGSGVSTLEKSLGGDRDERVQAIFREHPHVKASVDAGTLRVWIDDAGRERWTVISKRTRASKALHRVPIDDDRHEEIKSRAKELQDLIEKHPYIKEARSTGRKLSSRKTAISAWNSRRGIPCICTASTPTALRKLHVTLCKGATP